jgi:hypothetical protein
MKSLSLSVAALFLTLSSAQASVILTYNGGAGEVLARESALCIKDDAFYLKQKTIRVVTDIRASIKTTGEQGEGDVIPSRPIHGFQNVCVKMSMAKGSSHDCLISEPRAVDLPTTYVQMAGPSNAKHMSFSTGAAITVAIPACSF